MAKSLANSTIQNHDSAKTQNGPHE